MSAAEMQEYGRRRNSISDDFREVQLPESRRKNGDFVTAIMERPAVEGRRGIRQWVRAASGFCQALRWHWDRVVTSLDPTWEIVRWSAWTCRVDM